MDEPARNLGRNLRQLRTARGVSQGQISRAAGIPRATWSNLESGGANPKLAVLASAAEALCVSVEELLAPPHTEARVHRRDTLPVRRAGNALVRRLLPDTVPGTDVERMELPPGGRFVGIPHTAGTREYLTCESGCIEVTVAGEAHRAEAGDVVSFRGDMRHAYHNPGTEPAVGYAVVILAGM